MRTISMNSPPSVPDIPDELVETRNQPVLLLSQDEQLRRDIGRELGLTHYLIQCESLEDLKNVLESTPHRAVLAHMTNDWLIDQTAVRFMAELIDSVEAAPVYALLAPDCAPRLCDLAHKSADGCMSIPLDWVELRTLLNTSWDLTADLDRLLTSLPHKELKGHKHSLVTFTPELFKTIDDLIVAADYDVTILLTGETGSGKTHLAQLIHERSTRADSRLITVACGAIPPDLIESELFGYVRGAFTGADQDKAGKFAAAGNGTLLLDEIDVLPLDQQAKLLRIIETGEYEPVGSNETQISHARLIVASNDELPVLVKSGMFRSDLYYRLNVVNIHLPPLRDRPWDIEYLARKFAADYSCVHNIALRDSDPTFMQALLAYSWPGNIRELRNVIHRAVLYCRRGKLSFDDIPSTIRNTTKDLLPIKRPGKTLGEKLGMLEQRIIEDSLRRNSFCRKDTAAELGIGRVTLYNKMKKFGLMD